MLAGSLGALGLPGCEPPQGEVSPAPIPVAGEVGLVAYGSVGQGARFPMLVDTGTVLTTQASVDGGTTWSGIDQVTLWSRPAATGGEPVPRVRFKNVSVLGAPLYAVGVGDDTTEVGGILGGDLLQRFAVTLDYAAPSIALQPSDLACSCELADACRAVLPFKLAGGGDLSLGSEIHTYPATRVTLDACLEPLSDPVAREVPCRLRDEVGDPYAPGYEPDTAPGVDVRLLVATGFPGVLLGASAWDRLRGSGTAAALLAGPTVALRFAGREEPVLAAATTLGAPGCLASPCSALALVGREGLLGACGELSRSRRLRFRSAHPDFDEDATTCSSSPRCPADDSCLACLHGPACGEPNRCNDRNQPAAAVVELDGPIQVYVVDDTAAILQEVNADVRPELSDVEGVVGTELLARLQAEIDYPGGRIIAHCADGGTGCAVYPRFACPSQAKDCGPRGNNSAALCSPPALIATRAPVCAQ